MTRQFLTELGIEDKETINKIMDANGKTIEEFKEQIAEKDKTIESLKSNIAERDKDIENLKNAEDKVSKEDYQALQDKYAELEKTSKDDILKVKKDFMVEKEIASSNPKSLEIVKKQIDLDKVSYDGEKLIGLTDQLNALKESADYLFNVETKEEDKKQVTTGQEHTEADDVDDAFVNQIMGIK